MEEYRDVESTTRFDGYIFVAHNWNMLTGTDLEFKRGFLVRKTTPTELKGVTALQNENGVIAHIGDFKEFKVAVLITGAITKTGMEIERIRSAYIESVDRAAELLTGEWDGPTRQNLHADCHNFKARCDKLCDKCQNRAYVVHRDEVCEFGNAFQNLLKQKLADLRYKVCLIVWKFGQNRSLDKFWEWDRFKVEHASELIVHLARDFKETNKCLLWKEEDLRSHRLRNTANDNTLFRNFFVGGHVHMTYDATKPNDRTKRPVGLFPNKTGVVEIVTLKFYTSPFKEMHRGNENDAMWRRPNVQEALTVFPCKTPKKPEADNSVPITNILRYVQCTRNVRESLGNSHGNEARVEAVLILKLGPNARLGREDILKQFLQFFDDQVGPGQMRHLTRFKHEDFVQQIDNTIMAAVNTLEPILLEAQRRRLRMGEEYLSAVPDIYDLQLALACEALISFGVYGILNQFPRGIRYNEKLMKELKLQPPVYRNCVPFGGLNSCPAAYLVNGLVVYTGQLTITPRIWQNIEADLGDAEIARTLALRITSDITEFYRLRLAVLNNMPVPDEKFTAHFDSVADVMCKAIIGYKKIQPERALENAKLESGTLTCENSRDFVFRLFKNPNSFLQVGLAHVARAMGNTAETKLMNRFLQQKLVHAVAQKLEQRILQSKSLCLLYPITFDRQQVSLIVPYFGTAKDNYDHQSEESFYNDETWDRKRQVLHEVYNFIYCKTFGEVCRKDFCMEYVLQEQLAKAYSDAERSNGILRLMKRLRCEEVTSLMLT